MIYHVSEKYDVVKPADDQQPQISNHKLIVPELR